MATAITIDLASLSSIAKAISQGITTPEMLADAFPGELSLIDDCVVIDDSPVFAHDGTVEMEYPHDTDDAAQLFVDSGDYEATSTTCWVTIATYRKGVDAEGRIEHVEREEKTITIEPELPDCIDSESHQWESPYSILGGLKENPGVWSNGGGVICNEVCMLCGCKKTTDTWAQNPSNGLQGLTSVSYEEGEHSDEVNQLLIAKAKEALETEVELEGYEEDAANYDFVWVDADGDLVGCDEDDLREYGIRLRVDGDDAERPTGTLISAIAE